ncbi:MAG: four helix bundle protein [Clostridiaceae bacterium]|nr:four helix bundle protein [Clostridiaceae bacterium]
MSKSNFKELNIWQDAKNIAVDIYKITDNCNIKNDFSLRDQMRRAAVSIVSNIAEGNDRETDKEFVRFLYMAKGSCAELISQLNIAYDIGYIKEEVMNDMEKKLIKTSNMIGALIRTLYVSIEGPR